jgi:iron complex outermembrane receptor protein
MCKSNNANRCTLPRLLRCASLLFLGYARITLGQADASGPAAGDAGQLQEIIVTATRRPQSLQDVPSSVTAFDQTAITQLGITDIQDIVRLTPGLDITTGLAVAQPIISIRGIFSLVGTATTGIYIDDTPIQVRFLGQGEASASAFPNVFDLDRIEVLRGPQGTLFGSGSEGGTVRFITPEPSFEGWTGHALAQYSFLDNGQPNTEVGVAGGGPINDQLAFRASAYVEDDAGWINLEPYGGQVVADRNSNSASTQALTLAFTYKVNDALSITPSVFYQQQYQNNLNGYWANLSNPSAGTFVSGWMQTWPTTDRITLPALKVKADLGAITLYSNTSYLDHARDSVEDGSYFLNEVLTGNAFTGPVTASPFYFSNPQKQFTQEIRAQSTNPDARIHWVVGGFYQWIHQNSNEEVVTPGLATLTEGLFGKTVPQYFGQNLLPGGISEVLNDASRDTQLSAFGQTDIEITKTLSVTAGIRFAHSQFSATNYQNGPLNGGVSGTSIGLSENDNAPKVGITYKPTDDLMFYTTVAKGFRPGGGNTPLPALCAPYLTELGLTQAPKDFNSDHLWSYEVGSKGDALDRRLQWDASVFYIRWDGVQNQVLLPCGFSFIGNLGAVISKGFDAQMSAILMRGLVLGVTLGYTDARYTDSVGSGGAQPIVSAGEALQTVPWHTSVTLDYSFLTRQGGITPYLHMDAQYTSNYHTGNPNDALYDPVQDAYPSTTLVSARVGMKLRTWDVALFCKNLLDSHSILWTIHDVPTSELVQHGVFAPRSIGITAKYSF